MVVIHFTDVTDAVCPAFRLPGMVTAACFADINNDHYPELIIAGDWMPVMFLIITKENWKMYQQRLVY